MNSAFQLRKRSYAPGWDRISMKRYINAILNTTVLVDIQ